MFQYVCIMQHVLVFQRSRAHLFLQSDKMVRISNHKWTLSM